MKQSPTDSHWPAIQWSADEKLAFRKGNSCVHIHAGETWGTDVTNEGVIDRVVFENAKSVSVGPEQAVPFRGLRA